MESARLFAVPELESGPLDGLSHSTLGRIAELKAEVLLLERGHKVASPGVDEDGVDLVVDYRHRVQVKSTARLVNNGGRGAKWEFEFRSGQKDGLRGASNVVRARRLNADFVLCYARPDDCWWVIPAGALAGVLARVRIAPGSPTDLRWRDAWHLLRGSS